MGDVCLQIRQCLLIWLSESQIRRRSELKTESDSPLTYSTVILISGLLDPGGSDFWKKWQNLTFFEQGREQWSGRLPGAVQGIFCPKICSIFVVFLGFSFSKFVGILGEFWVSGWVVVAHFWAPNRLDFYCFEVKKWQKNEGSWKNYRGHMPIPELSHFFKKRKNEIFFFWKNPLSSGMGMWPRWFSWYMTLFETDNFKNQQISMVFWNIPKNLKN